MIEEAAGNLEGETSMYANVFSYLGLPLSRDLSDKRIDAVVMGVPYDLATSGRPGARGGPRGIRQASANLRWEEMRWPWSFALSERLQAVDYGDVQFLYGDSENMLQRVEEEAAKICAAVKTEFLTTVISPARTEIARDPQRLRRNRILEG